MDILDNQFGKFPFDEVIKGLIESLESIRDFYIETGKDLNYIKGYTEAIEDLKKITDLK